MADTAARLVRPIGDHGVIGNLETVAMIARDGTLDYLCWPQLDSPSVFADLLDPGKGGCFSILPDLPDAAQVQLYVPDTNVLLTRWMGESGSAEVLDLMPLAAPDAPAAPRAVLRRIRATDGDVRFSVCCMPRFDYGRVAPVVEATAGGVRFVTDALAMRLQASVPLEAAESAADAHFTLATGEEAWFVLGDDEDAAFDDAAIDALIAGTERTWRAWMARSTYRGRWREGVHRSALALKLLTSRKYGSIAAAATFSLPEHAGGERNWDYRATWIRDASFTTYAFMRLGYVQEAEDFNHWVAGRVDEPGGEQPFSIMYALDGSPAAAEQELAHMAGYAGSRPVRIGNDARGQLQLDIYGEMMDSLYLANKYGRAIAHENWQHVCATIEHVRSHWDQPDAGIWEMRSEPRHFLHSRVMCWVALDRAARLARKRSLSAPLVEWLETRDAISADIWDNFRHPQHGYFVQERGGTKLDGALLLMPLVRFVSATDPVWLSTLDAIGRELRDDGLVYRYRGQDDGLRGEEGAFTTCTFWYAECLARAGRVEEAQLVMAEGLAYANPLGLFAEETDRRGQPLGNFPQALTHLAFISAAYFLDRRLDPGTRPQWQP